MTHPSRPSQAAVNKIFGDALPDVSVGERDYLPSPDDDGDSDQWLRDNVPPHHG